MSFLRSDFKRKSLTSLLKRKKHSKKDKRKDNLNEDNDISDDSDCASDTISYAESEGSQTDEWNPFREYPNEEEDPTGDRNQFLGEQFREHRDSRPASDDQLATSDEYNTSSDEEHADLIEDRDEEQDMEAALARLVTAQVPPPKFYGKDTENVTEWLQNYCRVVTYNGWTNEKKLQAFPIHLEDSALVYYNSLPVETKNDYDLLSRNFTEHFNSDEKRWHLRTKLYSLKQTGELNDYINELEKLAQTLNIEANVKMDLFTNGLKPRLREGLLLRQPQNYEAAVRFAKLKNATIKNDKYDDVLKETEEIRKMIANMTIASNNNVVNSTAAVTYNESMENTREIIRLKEEIKELSNSVNMVTPVAYNNPTDSAREIVRLKEEVRRLRTTKDPYQHQNFKPTGNNLRTTCGQIICNLCMKVGHASRVCPQQNKPQYQSRYNNNYNNKFQQNRYNNNRTNFNRPQYNNNNNNYRNQPKQYNNFYRENDKFQNRNSNKFQQQQYTPAHVTDQTYYPAKKGTDYGKVQTIEIMDEIYSIMQCPSTIMGYVNGQYTTILVDSGAMCSIISGSIYDQIKHISKEMETTNRKLKSANNSCLKVIGQLTAWVMIEGLPFDANFKVAPELSHGVILGIDFLRKHKGVINFNTNEVTLANKVTIKMQHSGINALLLEDEVVDLTLTDGFLNYNIKPHADRSTKTEARITALPFTYEEDIKNLAKIFRNTYSESTVEIPCYLDKHEDNMSQPSTKLCADSYCTVTTREQKGTIWHANESTLNNKFTSKIQKPEIQIVNEEDEAQIAEILICTRQLTPINDQKDNTVKQHSEPKISFVNDSFQKVEFLPDRSTDEITNKERICMNAYSESLAEIPCNLMKDNDQMFQSSTEITEIYHEDNSSSCRKIKTGKQKWLTKQTDTIQGTVYNDEKQRKVKDDDNYNSTEDIIQIVKSFKEITSPEETEIRINDNIATKLQTLEANSVNEDSSFNKHEIDKSTIEEKSMKQFYDRPQRNSGILDDMDIYANDKVEKYLSEVKATANQLIDQCDVNNLQLNKEELHVKQPALQEEGINLQTVEVVLHAEETESPDTRNVSSFPNNALDKDIYRIEKILDERKRRSKFDLLIKSEGFDVPQNTWEPQSNNFNEEIIDESWTNLDETNNRLNNNSVATSFFNTVCIMDVLSYTSVKIQATDQISMKEQVIQFIQQEILLMILILCLIKLPLTINDINIGPADDCTKLTPMEVYKLSIVPESKHDLHPANQSIARFGTNVWAYRPKITQLINCRFRTEGNTLKFDVNLVNSETRNKKVEVLNVTPSECISAMISLCGVTIEIYPKVCRSQNSDYYTCKWMADRNNTCKQFMMNMYTPSVTALNKPNLWFKLPCIPKKPSESNEEKESSANQVTEPRVRKSAHKEEVPKQSTYVVQ